MHQGSSSINNLHFLSEVLFLIFQELMEELVQKLEKEWESIQRESEKKPSAGTFQSL